MDIAWTHPILLQSKHVYNIDRCTTKACLLHAREVEDAVADAHEGQGVAEDDGGPDGEPAELGQHVLCFYR